MNNKKLHFNILVNLQFQIYRHKKVHNNILNGNFSR